jgi:hypothetical protein
LKTLVLIKCCSVANDTFFLIYHNQLQFEYVYENIFFFNDLPPRFTLIKSMACGLALLASGQAMGADITSTGTGLWSSTVVWGGGAVPLSTDNAIINTAVISVNAATTINNLTVNTDKQLFLSATLTVDGTATINGKISHYNGTLSPKITSIGESFSANTTYTLPTTVTSVGSLIVSGATTVLTLAAANVVVGNVAINNGSIAGGIEICSYR